MGPATIPPATTAAMAHRSFISDVPASTRTIAPVAAASGRGEWVAAPPPPAAMSSSGALRANDAARQTDKGGPNQIAAPATADQQHGDNGRPSTGGVSLQRRR